MTMLVTPPSSLTSRLAEINSNAPNLAMKFLYTLRKIYRFAVLLITKFVITIKTFYNYLFKKNTFKYNIPNYLDTLTKCIEHNNAPQLEAWLMEYSNYTPTQILYGKECISIEMFYSLYDHLARENDQTKSEQEKKDAVNRVLDSKIRSMMLLFHPDMHINSDVSKRLLHNCATLIISAKTRLQHERSA